MYHPKELMIDKKRPRGIDFLGGGVALARRGVGVSAIVHDKEEKG